MNTLGIITRALRLLQVIAAGEEPDAADADDALSVFNSLLQALGIESLMIFVNSTQSIPFTAGQQSVTIGPSGTVVASRPVSVLETSYALVGNQSFPLTPLTPWDYNSISLKGLVTGTPASFYVVPGMPNITLYLYPVPSQAMTLVLNSNARLGTLTLDSDLVLPDGYDRMLAYLLAQDLAPEYGRQVTPDILRNATWAKKVIKRANTQVPRLDLPNGIPGGWDWYGSGGFTGPVEEGDVLVPVP